MVSVGNLEFNFEAFDFVVDALLADAERPGRFGFVAAEHFHRCDDGVAFDLFERLARELISADG